MKVTLYKQPDGRTQEIGIKNIRAKDADYFTEQGIRLSMEEIGGDFAVYALFPPSVLKGELEILDLAQGRSCEDAFSSVRSLCEDALARFGA